MTERIFIVGIGFLLDAILGDPHWLWHPVRGIGLVITWTEKLLRRVLRLKPEREADKGKKQLAGVLLVIVTLAVSVSVPAALLYGAEQIHPVCRILVSCIMCYQLLAMKSLRVESMKVYQALKQRDSAQSSLEQARTAVSMIVGRDTDRLTEEGIIKATVETVAENTSDGVIAPLVFLMLFGPLGGFGYKAVNTMDSMVGYRNDAYRYLGTAAARLDDLLNYIPARLAAWAMIGAAPLLGLDGRNAVRIYRRDRRCHASPNSAQTEAVCAGALGVQLAGDAWYFGKLHRKPTIGDDIRRVRPEDIPMANRLLYLTSFLVLAAGVGVMAILAGVC